MSAFTRNCDILTCKNNMLSSHLKRLLLLWLHIIMHLLWQKTIQWNKKETFQLIINGTLYVVNKTNQCSLSAMIFPLGWLHLSIKTVVMEIFTIWEALILSSVFDGINERLEIGLYLLSSLESRVSFLIRGRTIDF